MVVETQGGRHQMLGLFADRTHPIMVTSCSLLGGGFPVCVLNYVGLPVSCLLLMLHFRAAQQVKIIIHSAVTLLGINQVCG